MNPFPRMHVSLYVSNIKKTIEFYTLFFGQKPVKIKSDYAKYILEKPSLIISFVEDIEKVRSNFGHLGFQVESVDMLNYILTEARKNNMVSLEETNINCCYANQDKFWLNDPDGIQWEVYYFHSDSEFYDPRYEQQDKTLQVENQLKFSIPVLNQEPSCC